MACRVATKDRHVLTKIIISNLKQHDFLLITKTRKMREVLIIQGGEGRRGGEEAYNQMYVLFTGR